MKINSNPEFFFYRFRILRLSSTDKVNVLPIIVTANWIGNAV